MGQWKGSVIKLIYHSLFLYITLFMAINMFYRFILYDMFARHCNWKELEVNQTDEMVMYCNAEKGRQWFELFCVYCGRYEYSYIETELFCRGFDLNTNIFLMISLFYFAGLRY